MIQYFHFKYTDAKTARPVYGSEYTVAVEVPLKSDLLDLMTFGIKSINIDVGNSMVHPNDIYVKSIGRSVAKTHMMPTSFTFKFAQFPEEDTINLFLYSDKNELVFRVHRNSEKVYLISAFK